LLVSADARTELKLLRSDTLPFAPGERPAPGTLETSAPIAALRIATGDGWLVPLEVQRAGGKALAIAEFLRGFELAPGAHCERSEERA
jgi:methionyl-tRNA formyltransferase